MSGMTGFIAVDRSVWDHPLFTPSEMSEREAWLWMLSRAAWVETQHRVGNRLVSVPRGSFMATLREMQSAFMWRSDKRVRTFLAMLEKDGMIGRTTIGAANAQKTHITICNYDKFQTVGRTKDAPKTHDGRTADAVKEQENNKQEEEPNGSLSAEPTPIPLPHIDEISEAVSAYNASAEQSGWPKVQKLSQARRSAMKARLKECGGLDGWRIALAKARASPHLCGQNNRGWTANFDFLTSQSSFAKLMEGNYDAQPARREYRPADRPQNRSDAAIEQILRVAGVDQTPRHGRA